MSRPLHVLYVLNSPGGGATQGITELLSGLPKEQFKTYCVVPSQPDEYQACILNENTESFAVVAMAWWNRKLHLSPWGRLKAWGAAQIRTGFRVGTLLRLIALIRVWHIDVVYTSTAMILEGALAARLTRRPHLWHVKEWIGRSARTRFPLPDRWLMRVIAALSDRVLVMSRFIGEPFFRQGVGAKVVAVNDGVDLDRFRGRHDGANLRRKLEIGDNEILVAMAASLSSLWKKHALFIDMACLLALDWPQVHFAVFGLEPKKHSNSIYNKSWEYYQNLRRKVVRLGLEDRFIWAGFCRDIPAMMQAIDVLVHPCDIEPFGRVAVEAMAAGKPVVGPQQGGIAESVIDGETGFLVAPGDTHAFAQATARLLADPNLRRRLGRQGQQHVQKHFSLERHVQQITQIYRAVLHDRTGETAEAQFSKDPVAPRLKL